MLGLDTLVFLVLSLLSLLAVLLVKTELGLVRWLSETGLVVLVG